MPLLMQIINGLMVSFSSQPIFTRQVSISAQTIIHGEAIGSSPGAILFDPGLVQRQRPRYHASVASTGDWLLSSKSATLTDRDVSLQTRPRPPKLDALAGCGTRSSTTRDRPRPCTPQAAESTKESRRPIRKPDSTTHLRLCFLLVSKLHTRIVSSQAF